VLALVERGGSVRSFHIDRATQDTVATLVSMNALRESGLHTDESRLYTKVGDEFKGGHASVRHTASEYVRYTQLFIVHTNTSEGVFSIFKRGMKGIYQHCSEKHLHRYLAEFDFQYNTRIRLGLTTPCAPTSCSKASLESG